MSDFAALECDHCGDEAITSADNLFIDGDGGKCEACGFPGHVSVDDYDEPAVAYWRCDEGEGSFCSDLKCSDEMCAINRRKHGNEKEGNEAS